MARRQAAHVQLKVDLGIHRGAPGLQAILMAEAGYADQGLLCGAGPRLVRCAPEARLDRGEHHE